jgi:DNA-binding transcriptional LysR family regulator
MNLRQLDAFRAVMESGTVSRAAKRLSVSQPAVSKLIQSLEQAIGLVLFDRTRGRLSPSAEATMLFEEVERLFGGLSSLKTFAEEIRTLHHGSLRIGVMPALSTGFIQEVVADFVRDYPQAQISIHARSSLKLVDWLVAGHLDIGVTSHPVEHPELTQIAICRRQLVCILPPGHPLAKRRKLRPVDLSGERFISFTRDSHVRQALDQIFATAGVERTLLVDASMAPTVCALVARGLGISILDPLNIGFFGHHVAVRPFNPTLTSEIRILLPRHRQRSLATKAFVDKAQSTAGRLTKPL